MLTIEKLGPTMDFSEMTQYNDISHSLNLLEDTSFNDNSAL